MSELSLGVMCRRERGLRRQSMRLTFAKGTRIIFNQSEKDGSLYTTFRLG
jgi:hypothetical protein